MSQGSGPHVISTFLLISLSFPRFLFSRAWWAQHVQVQLFRLLILHPSTSYRHLHLHGCTYAHVHTHTGYWKQKGDTCQRWSRPQHCGHCSGGRVDPWPEGCHPAQKPSGGRKRQSAIHSSLQGEEAALRVSQSHSSSLTIIQYLHCHNKIRTGTLGRLRTSSRQHN